LTRVGKKYIEKTNLIVKEKVYSPEEAVDIVKKIATANFDETVELHMKTWSDPKHADQLIRGVAMLPHGTGKKVRVMAFVEGEAAIVAQEAGADYVADEALIKKIEGGWVDFEVSIATPDAMGKIGKLGRVLGRKGLMPNAKTGTVVKQEDLPKAIEDAKKGRVEFKMDRTAIIHVTLGKASFEARHLLENMTMVVDQIIRNRPGALKGPFIKSAFLTTTMGPSIKLDLASTSELTVE